MRIAFGFLISIVILLTQFAAFAEKQDILNPVNWVLRGNFAWEHGNFEEAIADYTEAVRRNSLDPVPLFDRARVYAKMGKQSEALDDARSSVAMSPSFADGWALIARLFKDERNAPDALIAINHAITVTIPPVPIHYYLLRAEILEVAGKPDEALGEYTNALHVAPTNAEALYASARIRLAQGREAEALNLLQRYSGTGRDSSEVNLAVVQLLIELNKPHDALTWLAKHQINDDRSVDYRAKALIMLGNSAGALALLASQSLHSEFGETLIGEAAMNQHDCPRAEAAFAEAVLAPSDHKEYLWRNYGAASACAGDFKVAVKALNHAIELDKTDAMAYRYRADVFRSIGNRVGAIQDARTALQLGGPIATVLMMLGVDEYMQGDRSAGVADYARGCSLVTAQELGEVANCKRQLPLMKNR